MRPLILICLALPMLSACGSSDDLPERADAVEGPAVGTDTAGDANTAGDAGIAGEYVVTGTNADGSAYRGTLSITPRGGAYAFAWEAGRAYSGFGVQQDDVVAVGFGTTGCGAVAYRMTADGLDGAWALPSVAGPGTERATRTAGTAGEAAGTYTTAGTNADGSVYTGALDVEASGNTFALAWDGSDGPSTGVGVVDGDVLASSTGATGCGVALYRVQPDGGLVGTWTDGAGAGPNSERAVRG